MPNIIAIIPARKGSKRIPDKNIKPLNGLPLIEYTILSAIHCNLINQVVVSSNYSAETLSVEKYGEISYHRRPEYLCQDESKDFDLIADILNNDRFGFNWDLVVYLRPTTPYRADYHLCQAIELMLKPDWTGTGLRSVELMIESAFKCFTINGNALLPITLGEDLTDLPNHMVEPTYKPNGYIDIIRPQMVLQGELWGNRLIGYETPHTPEIDTPADWDYAEWFGKRWVDAPLRHGKEKHETG